MYLDVILIGLNIENNIGLDFKLKLGPIKVSDPNYSYCRLMNMIFILYSWLMLNWQILEPDPQKYFNKLDCIILDDILVDLLFCLLCYI